MKKKIMALAGIVIFWGFLFWYMNLCDTNSAVRFFLLGVCIMSLVMATSMLFSNKEEKVK